MSENWNKKQLNKRLNSIFTDLDDTTEIPGLSIFSNLSGWIWEINTQGVITKCSPDIESFLGYNPETILNQPLSAISDFNLHNTQLPTHQDVSIVPTMLEMTFYHVKGTKTSTTVYILPRFNASKTFLGWRGVTILAPSIPKIKLPKHALPTTEDTNLSLSNLISPDEVAAPIPTQLVSKPAFLTELSPETQEALSALEENEQEEIIIDEPFAIPQPQPTDEIKDFLRSIDANPERVWEPEEIQLVEQVHSQLELALENATLFQQTQNALAETDEQARRLGLLNEMSGKLAQAQSLQEIYSIATSTTQEIFKADRSSIYLLTEDKQNFQVQSVAGELQEPKQGTIIDIPELFFTNQHPFVINTPDDDGADNPDGISSAVIGPISINGENIGSINVGSKQKTAFKQQDQNFMMQIVNLLNSTIENRTLFQQIERRSIQLETSAEVSRIATTILDPTELLPEVVELIKNGFGLYYAGIFLIDQDGDWTGEPNRWAVLRAGSGEAGRQMLENQHKLEIGGDSMIGTSISNSEARIALDVGEAASFFKNPYLPNTRSEMALPLISRGQVLGALSIQSETEAAFSQEDITSLQTLADQLANAIENARLFEQTEIRAEELAVLNEMARSFTQTLDVEELIKITHQYANRLMDADNFYLALFDSEDQMIEFKLFIEEGKTMPAPEPKLLLGDGLTDWIIKNKLPVLMPHNIENHLQSLGLEVRGRLSESWLGVPMLLENKVLGAIAVQSYTQPNTYGSHQLDLLSAVANQAAVAIDNAIRFQQSQARARFEQLLREITTRVHSSTNAESILRTAVREVSTALGKQAFIELNADGSKESNSHGQQDKTIAMLPSKDEQPQKGER